MHLVVLDDHETIANYVAAGGGRVRLDDEHCHARNRVSGADQRGTAGLDRAGSPARQAATASSSCISCIASDYTGAIVLMSGFDARVLASAQQIGNSLGAEDRRCAAKANAPGAGARGARRRSNGSHGGSPRRRRPSAPEPAPISVDEVARTHSISAGWNCTCNRSSRRLARAVAHAEALLRWRDPVRGLVLPDQFVPAAEQDEQLVDRLTMWVAETGAAHYLRLAELGSTIQISINISGRNLHALDFPDRMAALLERMALPSGAIGLEITESVAMHDLDTTAGIADPAAAQGISGGDRRFRHRAFLAHGAAADAVLGDQDRQIVRRRTGDVERIR